jgi:hypothetical protein
MTGSWALPLRHERISSFETPSQRASFQLKQVARHLSRRPIALYDRETATPTLLSKTQSIAADVLVRLAPIAVCMERPLPYRGEGLRANMATNSKLNDPTTWPQPTNSILIDDPELGRVLIEQWSAFHFRRAAHCPMEVIRIELLDARSVAAPCVRSG